MTALAVASLFAAAHAWSLVTILKTFKGAR